MPIHELEPGQGNEWESTQDATAEWRVLRCAEAGDDASNWTIRHHRHDWIESRAHSESNPRSPGSNALELAFKQHVETWRRDCKHTSSLTKMITHHSYLRIIGMGPAVLPFLFRELLRRPDHWLVALNSITGEDPAVPGSGFMEAVTAWLSWGERHGYLS